MSDPMNRQIAGRLEEAAQLLHDAAEHQYTVITAGWGPLRGCRVVAGRERECIAPGSRTAA